MDKQEILDMITRAQTKVDKAQVMRYKAQEELDKAQELLKEYEIKNAKEIKRWKPKNHDTFYFIDSDGEVSQTNFEVSCDYDLHRYNFYNCFKTRKQAKAEAEKILIRRQLEDIAKRLNRGKKINWFHNDCKYYIVLDTTFNLIDTGSRKCHKIQGVVYCLDENFAKVASREIGEKKLIKYLKSE